VVTTWSTAPVVSSPYVPSLDVRQSPFQSAIRRALLGSYVVGSALRTVRAACDPRHGPRSHHPHAHAASAASGGSGFASLAPTVWISAATDARQVRCGERERVTSARSKQGLTCRCRDACLGAAQRGLRIYESYSDGDRANAKRTYNSSASANRTSALSRLFAVSSPTAPTTSDERRAAGGSAVWRCARRGRVTVAWALSTERRSDLVAHRS
jgi:hypothetical protein